MKSRRKIKGAVGSSFENFLAEEGLLDGATERAIKRVLAWQIEKAMRRRRLTKMEMARRMRTSRAQLDRLLDPVNTSVTLRTMQRAAATVGKSLRIELV
jgi:antitoxin HicB